ncbi:FtsH protease activity modulator HflK [Desulfoferrobacter suflitae]|uniref:FtsH protease activity modulator HflK n=1 Tax=Desulfoferrobacter suflitae TaxID=2865782 RepID=UPI0021649306|nr:FtsH protease activity modulator HflK [Desulfoferrobacter suflitae]MCK8600596.1 FtsH protease activity modulator HflK [Desulfoferrobacter suflitae]
MDWDRQPHRGPGPGNIQDLEEVLRRLKDRYDFSKFPRGSIVWIAVLVVLILIGFNSYYTVDPQETAVVQRFGKFVRTADAGLHFKIPFGIETVRKVVTGRVLQREYGYRTIEPGARSRLVEKGYEEEARMLSGDLNVIDLQWTVQYKIQDPMDYLFQVQDVEATLDDISESVMRRIVGNRYVDEVLTVGRASVADMAAVEIQEIMNQYKTGLEITMVKLQNANPPDPVKQAFNEVNEAQQEKERMINEAQQVYNQKIPRAKGEARQRITQAEGYALERINKAQGEVARFSDILTEYEKAPDVTRSRMYLEAFADFNSKIDRMIVIDESQQNLLPLFDIGKMSAQDVPAVDAQ